MKRFVIILTLTFAASALCNAQNYLQHLQEKKDGQGDVTVTQSKEIDELVNKANTLSVTTPTATKKRSNKETDDTESEKEITHTRKIANTEPRNETGEDTESPMVDTRRKVLRKSYKVNGYRVQVFAGGNSRNDKIKAQRIGNEIKQAFPEQPIYVHFYSPRWICRIGNFRSFEEANNILHQIKKMGYKQACIVSGKITVPY